MILIGSIAAVVGLIGGGGIALLVGIVIVVLGVLEVTSREHFSGYRSHASLLSAVPAVVVAITVTSLFGVSQRSRGLVGGAIAAPLFAAAFWFLRKRFQAARQARIARPPKA
jgi:hypothetical protein